MTKHNACCYPFMKQKSLMTDYEIESDLLASQLGLCASIANQSMKEKLIWLCDLVYQMNGSIRGHNTILDEQVQILEKDYHELDQQLNQKYQFVLPTGTFLACQLHIARTQAKKVVRLAEIIHRDEKQVAQSLLDFSHLLANYLFVMAKYANQIENVDEIVFISNNY